MARRRALTSLSNASQGIAAINAVTELLKDRRDRYDDRAFQVYLTKMIEDSRAETNMAIQSLKSASEEYQSILEMEQKLNEETGWLKTLNKRATDTQSKSPGVGGLQSLLREEAADIGKRTENIMSMKDRLIGQIESIATQTTAAKARIEESMRMQAKYEAGKNSPYAQELASYFASSNTEYIDVNEVKAARQTFLESKDEGKRALAQDEVLWHGAMAAAAEQIPDRFGAGTDRRKADADYLAAQAAMKRATTEAGVEARKAEEEKDPLTRLFKTVEAYEKLIPESAFTEVVSTAYDSEDRVTGKTVEEYVMPGMEKEQAARRQLFEGASPFLIQQMLQLLNEASPGVTADTIYGPNREPEQPSPEGFFEKRFNERMRFMRPYPAASKGVKEFLEPREEDSIIERRMREMERIQTLMNGEVPEEEE